MKTSNKILIGLLTTIFLTITAMFIEIRVFGVHRSEIRIVQHEDKYELKEFSHIHIEDHRKIKAHPSILIKPSKVNLIKYEVYADKLIAGFKHTISGDTLKITSLADKPFVHSITVHSNSNIKSISVEGTDIDIAGIIQDSISLYAKGGEINCWGNDSLQQSKFKKCMISQADSKLNLHNVIIDTLEIDMIKSNAGFVKDILVLNADLKEQSNLQLRNVGEVKFNKDKSSKVYFH